MESLVLKSKEWGGSVPITCIHVSERVSTRRIVQRVYTIKYGGRFYLIFTEWRRFVSQNCFIFCLMCHQVTSVEAWPVDSLACCAHVNNTWSKHNGSHYFTRSRFNVGPPFATLAQRWTVLNTSCLFCRKLGLESGLNIHFLIEIRSVTLQHYCRFQRC